MEVIGGDLSFQKVKVLEDEGRTSEALVLLLKLIEVEGYSRIKLLQAV